MKKIFPLIIMIFLSGCAVSMAAKTKGVKADEAKSCQSRTCFLTLRDIQVMTSIPNKDGSLTETYKVLLKQGSAGRAVLHGLADIATLGIWELAGTPIEGSAGKDKFLIVTAQFDADGRVIATALGDRIKPTEAKIGSELAAPLKPAH
jgi:hypothetical protein